MSIQIAKKMLKIQQDTQNIDFHSNSTEFKRMSDKSPILKTKLSFLIILNNEYKYSIDLN